MLWEKRLHRADTDANWQKHNYTTQGREEMLWEHFQPVDILSVPFFAHRCSRCTDASSMQRPTWYFMSKLVLFSRWENRMKPCKVSVLLFGINMRLHVKAAQDKFWGNHCHFLLEGKHKTTMSRPKCFFDIAIGGQPAGRIVFEASTCISSAWIVYSCF